VFFLCWILLHLFLLSNAFAVKDFILRFDNSTLFYKTRAVESDNYPYSLQSFQIENDDYNFFYYTGHFRVIAGNYYKDYPSVQSLMKTIGDIAETVWKREVEDLGFKAPKNSEKYYIDIYLANKSAYNPQLGKYVSISSSYAGYATSYYDGTPYFVMNPSLSEDLIKVTIAHEFFHTVQFSYYDFPYISDEECNENCWWLEATAVWAETVTFPEVTDYLYYINSWVSTSYISLDTFNGDHEYGSSILPIYLYYENSNSTLNLIRNSFETYALHKNFISYLEENIDGNYEEESLAEVLAKIAYCVSEKSCFPNSEYLTSDLNFSSLPGYLVGYYSIFPFYTDSEGNVEYVESPVAALGKISTDKGIIIPKRKDILLDSSLIQENLRLEVSLDENWMLLSNPYSEDINPESAFGLKNYILWIYDNDTWECFSDVDAINNVLEQFGLYKSEKILKKNQAFWLKASEFGETPENIKSLIKNIQVENKWMLISLGDVLFPVDYLKSITGEDFILWTYENGKWELYSSLEMLNDIATSYGIELIETVGGIKGYWIKIKE